MIFRNVLCVVYPDIVLEAGQVTIQKDVMIELRKLLAPFGVDSWIDIEGGISTLFVFSGKGRREMPNGHVYLDGQHILSNS